MLQGILKTKDYQEFRMVDEATGAELCAFNGAKRATRALPGDLVTWTGVEVGEILLRAPGRLHLVGTLELAAKVRYGMTSRGIPIYRFTPFSEAYPPFFVGSSEKDVRTNRLVRVEFAEWRADSTCPRGNLIQTFGVAGDLTAEEEALLWHYGATRYKAGEVDPWSLTWPAEVATPPAAPSPSSALAAASPKPFHIDPAGCRDIDDAITLIPMTGGIWRVRIHIANVGAWLLANPQLVGKAAAAGQTLYREGVAVRPMFPPELSEGVFSLLPGERRAVLTMEVPWNDGSKGGGPRGLCGRPIWLTEVITVAESYTYESVAASPWASPLAALAEDLAGHACPDPHDWVAQLMLLYNREAAKRLREAGRGILRRHAAPDQARFDAYAALGLPATQLALRAGEYCDAAAPAEEVRHWGLGEAVYCHATSPIRRWADALNQLVLLGHLDTESIPFGDCVEALNMRAKAAKAYERDLAFARLLLAPDTQKEWVGVIAEPGRVWVPAWGRLQRADTAEYSAGQEVRFRVYCDGTQKNWKRRLIVRIL